MISEASRAGALSTGDIRKKLVEELGQDVVEASPEEIEYFSQDYFSKGMAVEAVLQPGDIDTLARCVALAEEMNLAVYPRGGGYSYTSGYLARKKGVLIDTGRMNRVLYVNEQDNYVTVEAGCTWAKLDEALKPYGLRTPFWGPSSGLRATVGGSVSQGSIGMGSNEHGLSSASVVDLEVVAGGGRRVRTGVSSQARHTPFFRNYGPDLTGIFCSDCGALGIKAHVTLRLIRRPAHHVGVSFGFRDFESCAAAAARVASESVTCESFGMSKARLYDAVDNMSLGESLQTLFKVARSSSDPWTAAKRIAGIVFAGKGFAEDYPCTLQYAVEGNSRALAEAKASLVRKVAGQFGTEIQSTVPEAVRADPFMDHMMLSPTGQRQLPSNTVLPFSKAATFNTAFFETLEELRPRMKAFNMDVILSFATIGSNGFLYETVVRWDDRAEEFHRRHTPDKVIEGIAHLEANPEARDLANEIRQILIDLALRHGGIHLQIGKAYPYLEQRATPTVNLLRTIKSQLDPKNTFNPGALGLDDNPAGQPA